MDELSEEDKTVVTRARKVQRFLTQNFFVAEQFTGMKGQYCKREDTVTAFTEILAGKYDHIDEQHFYMVESVADAVKKHEEAQEK